MACPSFAADEWSKQDYLLEATYLTLHVIDWRQTLTIADDPNYTEMNPVLGKYPTRSEVNAWFAASALLHIGVTHLLPSKYRPYWQSVTIVFSGSLVANNASIGIKMDF